MEEKEKNTKHDKWKKLTQSFVGNILEHVEGNASYKIHLFFLKLKRRTIGSFLALIGAIFLLIAAALFIGTFFPENLFAGWLIAGFALLAIGYLWSKG